jgi:peptidoglycan/xylan/chitin deacetylase (PgdA/CDA1 family)
VRSRRWQGGQTIGAHTLTHPNLPGYPEEAEARNRRLEVLIEEKIKAPRLHFAYPNGRASATQRAGTGDGGEEAGFLSSVTSINGPVYRDDDPFTLQRLGGYRSTRPERFALDIERTRLAGPKA